MKIPLFTTIALSVNLLVPAVGYSESSGASYTLERCIETALEHNYEISRARERLERAGAVRLTAASGLFPAVRGTANFQDQDRSLIPNVNGGSFGTDRTWSANVEVSQTIFAGGKYWGEFRAQQKNEAAAAHELQAVINNTLLEVRSRYYNTLLAKAQVVVEEQSIDLLKRELENERKKNAAGTVSDFNVLRAEVALANGQPKLIRARNTYVVSREELRQVLGLHGVSDETSAAVEEEIQIDGALGFNAEQFMLNELLVDAIHNRPEILRLKNILEASKHETRAAYAGHIPDIQAYAGYGIEKNMFTDDIQDDLKGWRAGVRAQWNIFDSLGTVGKIQAANATRNDSRLALEQQKIAVEVEVRRAYSGFTESKNLVEASKEVVRQAEESFRLARSRADAGAATQLDVLDSEVALTDARTNEIRALHDYAIAVAALKRAAGTLELPSKKG